MSRAFAAAAGRVAEALAVVREHPRHVVLFALVAGLLCGAWAPVLVVAAALVALWLGGRPLPALLAAVAVLGGAAVAQARQAAIDTGRLPVAMGGEVTQRFTLLEPFRERASGELVARAAVHGGRATGEPLLLRVPDRSRIERAVDPGSVVRVAGRLVSLGRFDRIQRRRGALAAVLVERLEPTELRRGGVEGALDATRRRAEAGFRTGVPEPQAALLEGMVLGRDDRIPVETREAFQVSGLAHLLAVSGTNVLLLAALVLGVGAVTGLPLRARLLAALALVALYVPLTGAGPSIQRAGVMGAAGLVAAMAGRPASRWYALGLAGAATLVWNPYAAGEAGWQLSFAAVVGLMWLAPGLRERLELARVPKPLAEGAAMTLAATVATAPLLAVHFEYVSLVSLPANLVVTVVVAPIMWLGMLSAAVAQVDPALALPLNVVNAPLAGFVETVAHAAAAVPGATAEVRLPGLAGAVLGYLGLGLAWLGVKRLGRPGGSAGRWRAAAAPAAALVLVVWLVGGSRPPVGDLAPGETAVSFLDVGQGDATLVQRDGRAVLFDTGPSRGNVVARLQELGVRRLDALVITHAQDDHEGAAITVLERLRPRLVIDGGAGWPTPVQRALPGAAARAGSRVVTAAAGDALRLGALRIDVLWPPAVVAEAPATGDPNDRALVAHVRSGAFDVLLAADAESNVTGHLELPDVEVLKVAHHGSEDAGLRRQLEQLRPEVAAIQVGRHNTYGHPAPSTLAALRVVPQVLRTDRDGTARVRARDGRLTVERLGRL